MKKSRERGAEKLRFDNNEIARMDKEEPTTTDAMMGPVELPSFQVP